MADEEEEEEEAFGALTEVVVAEVAAAPRLLRPRGGMVIDCSCCVVLSA